MSTLSAFPFIGEQSFATPGSVNSPLSIISANIAAINSDVGAISGVTISPPSGNTIQMPSDLSISGYLSVGKGVSIGTQAPGTPEPVALTIGVNSGISDYIYFNDTANLRSDYLLGSHAGGTADGLNIFDVSGNTMIVSFSKQSIRFYQHVVGPVFDVGGALADTLNAATFGTGADSKESRIQAAISTASAAAISRVYLPANMYPYSAASVSFDTRVLMVREGGSFQGYDVKAYGADGSGVLDATVALQTAINHAFQLTGEVFLPLGVYRTTSSLTLPYSTPGAIRIRGEGVSQRLTGGVSGEAVGNYGSRISFAGPGDLFYSQVTADNVRQHIQLEKLYLQNAPSAASGSCIYLRCNNALSAIIVGLDKVAVNGAKQHGMFFEGNVIESSIHDCAASQCVDRGIKCSAVSGLFPVQVTLDSIVCYLNGTGMELNGGGNFTLVNVALIASAANQLYVDGSTQVFCLGLSMEYGSAAFSGGTVFARLNDVQRSSFNGININYGSNSSATGILFDGTSVSNAIIGVATNAAATNTDFVITGACNYTNVIDYYAVGFQLYVRDAGQNTLFQRGSHFSQPLRLTDGTAANPAYAFAGEPTLGWYRSGISAMGLSYGQIQVPTGTALLPSYGFSSESSLGFYRSTTSIILQSYGTFGVSTVSLLAGAAGGINVWFPNNGALRTGAAGNVYIDVDTFNLRGGAIGDSSRGYILAGNGANSVPTYGFSQEATLGFYKSGASTVALSQGRLAMMDGSATTAIYSFISDSSLGWYRSGVSTIAQSFGTLNLATNAVRLSMRTIAASALTASAANTNVAVNECVFTVSASGASFAVNSGGTTWVFNSDASAKNT